MRAVTPSKDVVIEFNYPQLTTEMIEKVRAATETKFTKSVPLTLPTMFRRPEFDWLERLGVDLRTLLHTEQEYHYHAPLAVGDNPKIRTWISDFKERKGKQFSLSIVEMTSDVHVDNVKKITAVTNFVIKTQTEGATP